MARKTTRRTARRMTRRRKMRGGGERTLTFTYEVQPKNVLHGKTQPFVTDITKLDTRGENWRAQSNARDDIVQALNAALENTGYTGNEFDLREGTITVTYDGNVPPEIPGDLINHPGKLANNITIRFTGEKKTGGRKSRRRA